MLVGYGVVVPAGVPTPLLPVKPDGEFSIEQLESAAGVASLLRRLLPLRRHLGDGRDRLLSIHDRVTPESPVLPVTRCLLRIAVVMIRS